jgi:hypothetical protein
MFLDHFAMLFHVLRATCTVFPCFGYDIIMLQKPQGVEMIHTRRLLYCPAATGEQPLSTNSLNVPAGHFALLSSGTVRACTRRGL